MILISDVKFVKVSAPTPYANDQVFMVFGMFLRVKQRLAIDSVELQLMPAVFHEQFHKPCHFLRPLVVAKERIVEFQRERPAVAKTCSNAERILCLPKEGYAAVAAIAREADGHAILRATEIFAKTESDLRFVSSPRICLETDRKSVV